MADLDAAALAAWERHLDSISEPPFDNDHYRYHTPNRPADDCANCRYAGWAEDENRERDLFMAGWNAATGSATSRDWCVRYGGEDPNHCAGTLVYDDQAEAEEMAQWMVGGRVAYRAVARGPWIVPEGQPAKDGGE
jgi:hypothetical protein